MRQSKWNRIKGAAALAEYARHRTRRNLIRILDTYGVEGETADVRSLLHNCSTRTPCLLYGCPNCGTKIKRKAKLDSVKKLVAKAGRLPSRNEMSFVTILGPTVPLEPACVTEAMRRFRRQLTRAHVDLLPDTSWIGFFDVSLRGVLHWHGVILHERYGSEVIEYDLAKRFAGDRVVWVSDWHEDGTDLSNLEAVLNYSLPADRHVRFAYRSAPEVESLAPMIGERIVCLQHMARRGSQGVRLALNVRSAFKWKAGVMHNSITGETKVIPEIEELILNQRRPRQRRRRASSASPVKAIRDWVADKVRGVREGVTDRASGVELESPREHCAGDHQYSRAGG